MANESFSGMEMPPGFQALAAPIHVPAILNLGAGSRDRAAICEPIMGTCQLGVKPGSFNQRRN